jgi:hypothetical protein
MQRLSNPITPPQSVSKPTIPVSHPSPALTRPLTAQPADSVETRAARFKAQMHTPTASPGLDLEAAQQALEAGLETLTPQQIQNNFIQVPRPGSMPQSLRTEMTSAVELPDGQRQARVEVRTQMQQVLQTLPQESADASQAAQPVRFKHLESREQERLQTSREQVSSARQQDQLALTQTELTPHQAVLAQEFDMGNLLVPPARTVDLRGLVADRFASMEKALRPTFLMPGKQQSVLEQAQKQAFQLTSTARPESDMLFKMVTWSPEQFRDEIARSVSGLRTDRYGQGVDYQNLSPKKQALVDAMIKGFQQGLARQSHEVHQAIASRMSNSLRTQLAEATPESDLVFSLTLKSKADIMGVLGVKLGLVQPEKLKELKFEEMLTRGMDGKATDWLNDLRPGQKALIESMASELCRVLNQSLPNKPSHEMIRLQTDQGTRQAPSQITLNGKTYSDPQLLGTGGLGLILNYTDKRTGESVVIKSLLNMHGRDDMVKELQAHRHVMGGAGGTGHQNVIGLRGVVRGDDDSLYMVMDRAQGGDLSNVSHALGHAAASGALPLRARIALIQTFTEGAVRGMQHMQSRNMMHLDVKDLNFLLDENGRVMLSDFGSGQRTNEILESARTREDIPTTYSAPEWNTQVSQKSDIYQFGRTLRSLMGEDHLVGAQAPGHGAATDFINAMLDSDPTKRPTLEALASSSFLQDVQSQDTTKMQTLLKASVAYAQVVGKDVTRLQNALMDCTDDLRKAEKNLDETDTVRRPELAIILMNEVRRLTDQMEDLQAQTRAIHDRPEVRPLLEALTRASQGLV